MNAFGSLSTDQIALFCAVLARAGGVIVAAPIVGEAHVPARIKAAFIVVLSVALMAMPAIGQARVPTDLGGFSLVIVAQLLTGLLLGFVARGLVLAAQTAGRIVNLSTGLSLGAAYNPLAPEPDPLFGQLYVIIASFVFIALDGEGWLMAALARSFDLAPVSATTVSPAFVTTVITATTGLAASGLMMALPVTASLTVATLVLGVLARALPQLNVFVLSLPLNLLLGLLALIGGLGAIVVLAGHQVTDLPHTLLTPLRAPSRGGP